MDAKWRAAIDLQPHRRLPLEQRRVLGAVLAARYRDGYSIMGLARDLGTSAGRVRHLLSDHGVRFRRPGGSAGRDRSERDARALALACQYAGGATLAVLSEQHALPASTVRRLVLAGGGALRRPGSGRRRIDRQNARPPNSGSGVGC